MTRPHRSALFGGTFDPPHLAHVALAHAALDALALDDVRWIPAGQPWQKLAAGGRAITPAAHRVAMVQLAMAGEPRFKLERIEVDRDGASYTIDTVQALAAREPQREWVLLIGQDQYVGLHTWHRWRELLAGVTLAVAGRPGALAAPAPEVAAVPHRMVPLPMMDISASDIRARVAAGRDIAALVPAEVAGYIARHGLYRSSRASPAATALPQPRSRTLDIRKLQRAIVDGLEDVKAHNIVVFNTEALSPLFERVIIASGSSNRQTRALANSVRETVKKRGLDVLRTEGEDNAEWIIVDCGAAVAHIMQPAIRDYYHLEEIWGAKPVKMKGPGDGVGVANGAARSPAKAQAPAPVPKAAPAPAGKRAKPAATPAAAKPAAKAPAARVPAKKATAKKATAKKATAKKATAKKTPARRAAAAKAPGTKLAGTKAARAPMKSAAKKPAGQARKGARPAR